MVYLKNFTILSREQEEKITSILAVIKENTAF